VYQLSIPEDGNTMKQNIFTITDNRQLADKVFRMELSGDVSAITSPGQFVNISLNGKFLRRPISVCDKRVDHFVIIYKIVGDGTALLSAMNAGETLDILTGLGNGYDLSCSGDRPLLAGGGAGVPPLYWLCRNLADQGKKPIVILGFNKADEVFYEEEFRKLNADVSVMTADGSYANRGFVTDGMKNYKQGSTPLYTYIYACGPLPMLYAVNNIAETSGQFSFEERMGCGFGACMGCSFRTLKGDKRICKDGPVFKREEIIWQTS